MTIISTTRKKPTRDLQRKTTFLNHIKILKKHAKITTDHSKKNRSLNHINI